MVKKQDQFRGLVIIKLEERKHITNSSLVLAQAGCTTTMSQSLVTRPGSRMQSAVSVVSIYLSLGSFGSDFANNDLSPVIHCLFVANLTRTQFPFAKSGGEKDLGQWLRSFSLKMTVWIIQAMKAISQESSQAIPVWQLFNIEMKVKMINLLHNFHQSSPVIALLDTK